MKDIILTFENSNETGVGKKNLLSATSLFAHPEIHREVENELKSRDMVLVAHSDESLQTVPRDEFLPANGYLIHFNIASAEAPPHIEPLPNAHDTISTSTLCMIEGQKQYVLEMEAAVIGVLENGKMQPLYIGTLADFGDRTPRLDNTGRTYKTWTIGIENGGSTGMSTTWMEIKDWNQIKDVELEYWVSDANGDTILHTPKAKADTLKMWGERLGEWVSNYSKEKLEQIGVKEGVPFLLSTGQILYEDDGARSINPSAVPSFTARAVMNLGEDKVVETIIKGETYPRSETTFAPTEAPFSYYQ